MEALNNGHSGDRPLVHCREVVIYYMLQSVGGKQFVRSTEVVRFSECPLSEVPLYTATCTYSFNHFPFTCGALIDEAVMDLYPEVQQV